MDAIVRRASSLKGVISVPADKAICHRTALLCALTNGSTTIAPWSTAEDCQQTLSVLRGLGVKINEVAGGIRVTGVGLEGLKSPTGPLSCGESGTTMRLACGVLAGQPFTSELTAEGSLRQRPMRRIIEPLRKMGAQIQGLPRASFEGYPPEDGPPLEIIGKRPLRSIRYDMPVASAQVKSAILLAGLFADGPTTVVEPATTRDHTERLLSRLGVSVRRSDRSVTIEPPARDLTSPGHLIIPGDPSSAAFFIVAAAVLPGSEMVIHNIGLNESRIHFLKILERMGASIQRTVEENEWEPRGTVTVRYQGPLHGTEVSASEVALLIDELPILMVAVCAAEGETRFERLGELRVKESDRIEAMTAGLRALDAQLLLGADKSDPDLVINGRQLSGGTPEQTLELDSFNDHRIAMSLAIAGLVAEGETRISGVECIGKSFGKADDFFTLLQSVAGSDAVKLIDPVR